MSFLHILYCPFSKILTICHIIFFGLFPFFFTVLFLTRYSTDSIDILLDKAEQLLCSLAQENVTQELVHIKDILPEVIEDIHNKATDNKNRGLSTGFPSIDNLIVGMNRGDLIVVGAKHSMEKTAFVMNIAVNVAKKIKPLPCLSLEWKKKYLIQRLLSSEASVDNYKLRMGILSDNSHDWNKIIEATSKTSEYEIYVDDTPKMTVTNMKSKLIKLKKLDLIIIDYLQLIQSGRRKNYRNQEILLNLKIMAKQFGVPIIVCSQLPRRLSKANNRPMLSDLRFSGVIREADTVIFLHHKNFYKADVENRNRTEIIFAKNKHGSIGKIEIGFSKKYTKFYDLE